MTETIHVVRHGESLSSIAQRHYGSPKLWPSIYAFTNVLAGRRRHGFRHIVNPNRLRVGDRVALPAIPSQARWSLANDQGRRPAVLTQVAPATQSESHEAERFQIPGTNQDPSQQLQADNPATETLLPPYYGWIYKLDDLTPYVVSQNGFRITVKLKGEVAIQPKEGTPLVKLSNRDAQLDLQREADTVMGQLLSDYQLTYDAPSKAVKFACKLTQVGQGGAPSIGFAIPMPPDIVQEFITYKPIKGTFAGHGFLAATFTVEITLGPDQQPASQVSRFQPQEEMPPAIDWHAVALALFGTVVIAAGIIFFAGPGLAAAALVVGAGLGASALWNATEAKGLSGPFIGHGSGGSGPSAVIDVYTTGHQPQ